VAQLVGTPKINLLPAARTNGTVHVKDSGITVPAPALDLPDSFLLGVRPEDVRPAARGAFSAQVRLTEPLGVETILHLQSGDLTILCLVAGMAPQKVGESVKFDIVQDKLHFFGADQARIASARR
jgi:ABC-type sugar transport system ATPase subunit